MTKLLSFFSFCSDSAAKTYKIRRRHRFMHRRVYNSIYIGFPICGKYLADHEVGVAPVEGEVAENASVQLVNELGVERLGFGGIDEEGEDVLLAVFRLPEIIVGQPPQPGAPAAVLEPHLASCRMQKTGDSSFHRGGAGPTRREIERRLGWEENDGSKIRFIRYLNGIILGGRLIISESRGLIPRDGD